jgi:hypothetical protein
MEATQNLSSQTSGAALALNALLDVSGTQKWVQSEGILSSYTKGLILKKWLDCEIYYIGHEMDVLTVRGFLDTTRFLENFSDVVLYCTFI